MVTAKRRSSSGPPPPARQQPTPPTTEELAASIEKKFVSATLPLLVANEEWRRESLKVEWRASLS